jgi:hypothetical protein
VGSRRAAEAKRSALRSTTELMNSMAGLMHDFHLLERSEFDYWDYSNFYNHPQAVQVHDDLLRYLSDSLKWIPCHFPKKRQKLLECKGLNLIGVTIIKAEGASIAQNVFDLWADLFSHGPEELELTGGWVWIDGEPMESGKFSTIVEERDDLVSSLRQIAEYAKRVSESQGRSYLLHLGI